MAIRNKTIIVTGGAGFIGSNIVERLAAENRVIVLDNMFTGSPANLRAAMKAGSVSLVRRDSSEIACIKARPDLIMHLGMYSSTPMYKEDNYRVAEVLRGAISVFRYAVRNRAPVVFASSSSVYNGNTPPYRESLPLKVTDFYTEARIGVERLAELYSGLYGLDATGLRLFSVYGRHEEAKQQYANLVSQFLWAVKQGKPPVIYGDGSQTRDFTFVDDVVEAFVRASSRKGFNLYNVGTGRSYDMKELIRKLERHTGRKIRPKFIKMPVNNYVMFTLADTAKARRELGFTAKYDLDMGIRNLVDYYKLR
jgi:UDP-glucose 4-epimerase